MIICAPVPEHAYDTMTATEFRQLCCARATMRKKIDILEGSNFADTLYQGGKSLERPAWKYRNTGALPSIPSRSRQHGGP